MSRNVFTQLNSRCKNKRKMQRIKSSIILVLFSGCFSQQLVLYTKWHLSFNAEKSGFIYQACVSEKNHKTLVPYHVLVSLSNLWQSLWSQGLKDTRCRGKRGSKSWRKINTALWNKKCGLFTFHWSDDAGETPQTGIKLREYIF